MRAPATRQDIPAKPSHAGCLYLVGTPIGNLEDITLRALRVLKEADLIACEDTRHTVKLLNHFEIRKHLLSYHEHNEHIRAPELVAELETGSSVALVSDAGMPLVSDPGERLVRLAIEHGIAVVPVPGPSALTAALAASGLPVGEFLFAGFLPAQMGKRRRALAGLAAEPRTLIFYEAPHRIAAMLADARAALGNRRGVIAREITKLHEEFLRGSLDELIANLGGGADGQKIRGEITVLISPPLIPHGAPDVLRKNAAAYSTSPFPAHMKPARGRKDGISGSQDLDGVTEPTASATGGRTPSGIPATTLTERVLAIQAETGVTQKAALKLAAREFGLPRRAAYQRLLDERPDKNSDDRANQNDDAHESAEEHADSGDDASGSQ